MQAAGDMIFGDGVLPDAVPSVVRLVYAEGSGCLGRVERLDGDNRTSGQVDMGQILAQVPCFTPGARIATERGERPVEALRPGDRVVTFDHGMQSVLWTGTTSYGWRDLGALPVLRPVRIRAGALGDGVPERDLLVSPNHRLLVRPRTCDTGVAEALVQAIDLVGRPGIDVVAPLSVDYVHVLLIRHELVMADGAWTESFQAEAPRLAGLNPVHRAEIARILAADGITVVATVRPEITGADVGATHC